MFSPRIKLGIKLDSKNNETATKKEEIIKIMDERYDYYKKFINKNSNR